jgi:hypothetical protein
MRSISLPVRASLMFLMLSMLAASARAEDKTGDDQYQTVAAQRLKAELACKKALMLADGARSGWTESSQALDVTGSKIQSTYQIAIRTEQAKPEGERDPALITEYNAQLQQLDQDWKTLLHDRNILANTYGQLGQDANRVRGAFDNMIGVERAWKEAGLDLTGLGASYDTVAKIMDGYSAQAQQAISDLKAKQKEWDARLDSAIKAAK